MFLAVSVRGILVFALASVIILLFKRLSSEHRHLIWFVVIVSFVVISAVWLTTPSIDPVLSIPVEQGETRRIMTVLLLDRAHYVELVAKPERFSQTIYASPSRLPLIATLVWVAGVLFFLAPLILGQLAMKLMGREAVLHTDQKHIKLAKKLAARLGISRYVVLMTSDRCSVPFTYGFRRPFIVMPYRMHTWTKRQLEAVLIHELAHIRRRDCLTQLTARVICGAFWFVPLIWIAYARLQREQERACDIFVIDAGIKPVEYAGHIVDLVRFSKGHILQPGMSNAMGMKSMLNQRIKSVLSLKSDRLSFNKRHLWGLLFICIVMLASILAVTVGLKTSSPPGDTFGELHNATWVNLDYDNDPFKYSKIVWQDEGVVLHYLKSASP